MTEVTYTLYLPCEVYEIRALVGLRTETLGTLEQLVLEAIGHGVKSFRDLSDIFMPGLGDRPMLDLILDLWHMGHVAIDVRESTIELSSDVRARIEQNTLHELATAQIQEARVPVMRELISGHLLQTGPRPWLEQGSLIAPAAHFLARGVLPPERRAELFEVVDKSIRGTPAGRQRRCYGAMLQSGEDAEVAPTQDRYLQVQAHVRRDLDTDQLRFQIVHPTFFGPAVRRDIEEQLGRMAEEVPQEKFFTHLRKRVSQTRDTSIDLQTAMQRLHRAVVTIRDGAGGLVEAHHKECIRWAEEAVWLAHQHQARRANVQFLAGAAEILRQVEDAIRSAQEQLVLVCPWVHFTGYQRLRDLLREALDSRAINIFVIWGIGRDETPNEEFVSGLQALASRATKGTLRYATRSARTHAKVVIRDWDWVMVGSYNFLSRQTNPLVEMAAVIQSDYGEACATAIDLLSWARRIFDDYSVGTTIRTTPAVVTSRQPRGDLESAADSITFPDLPESRAEAVLVDLSNVWRTREAEIRRLAESNANHSWTVLDGQHRDFLWRALHNAQSVLLVTSDKLSGDVVDDRFLDVLRKRLEERGGLVIILAYRESLPLDVQQLRNLREAFPDHLHLVPVDNQHAKILAWDDTVIISSFNFLSFEGVYQGGGKVRIRSEVGARIEGPGNFVAAYEILRTQVPMLPRLPRYAVQAIEGKLSDGQSISAPGHAARTEDRLVQRLLTELTELQDDRAGRVNAVAECFSALDADTPLCWFVLQRLKDAQVTTEDLHLAVAWCHLSSRESGQHDHHRAKWIAWRATQAWQDQSFFDTVAYLAALDGQDVGPELPSLSLASAAALWRNPVALKAHLLTITSTLPTERLGFCAAALHSLLVHDNPEAADFLAKEEVRASGALCAWVDAGLDFWHRIGRSLPLDEVQQWLDHRKTQHAAQIARNKLETSYAQAEHRVFRFDQARFATNELFGPGKLMDPLLRAAKNGKSTEVAEWLERHGDDDHALEIIIDKATDMANRGANRIPTLRRRAIVRSLLDVVQAARDWVAADNRFVQPPDPYLLNAATGLGAILAVSWDELKAELGATESIALPSTPVVRALLAELEPLITLYKSESQAADESPH